MSLHVPVAEAVQQITNEVFVFPTKMCIISIISRVNITS